MTSHVSINMVMCWFNHTQFHQNSQLFTPVRKRQATLQVHRKLKSKNRNYSLVKTVFFGLMTHPSWKQDGTPSVLYVCGQGGLLPWSTKEKTTYSVPFCVVCVFPLQKKEALLSCSHLEWLYHVESGHERPSVLVFSCEVSSLLLALCWQIKRIMFEQTPPM